MNHQEQIERIRLDWKLMRGIRHQAANLYPALIMWSIAGAILAVRCVAYFYDHNDAGAAQGMTYRLSLCLDLLQMGLLANRLFAWRKEKREMREMRAHLLTTFRKELEEDPNINADLREIVLKQLEEATKE